MENPSLENICMTFSSLGVLPSLVATLGKQGIVEPTPIQSAALPILLAKQDAYLTSETGSGKTLAYLLPLLSNIDLQVEAPQVLVVVPTHELAIQLHRTCCDLVVAADLPIRSVLLLGGTPMDRQIEKLKKKPHIAIGSPGRLLELIGKGKLKVNHTKSVVVDEADSLLTKDSFSTIRSIIGSTPKNRQLVFVSATELPEYDNDVTENTDNETTVHVPHHAQNAAARCNTSASEIAELTMRMKTIRAATSTAINPNISHFAFHCESRKKADFLRKLIRATLPELPTDAATSRALVFVHRNEAAQIIAMKMAHHGILVGNLLGADDKSERKKAMDDFRAGRSRVLIASDVAARGLDIPSISHVFNYDVPSQSKDYLHRVGRTARAGASGAAISLVTEADTRVIQRIASELEIEIGEIGLREGRIIYPTASKFSPPF